MITHHRLGKVTSDYQGTVYDINIPNKFMIQDISLFARNKSNNLADVVSSVKLIADGCQYLIDADFEYLRKRHFEMLILRGHFKLAQKYLQRSVGYSCFNFFEHALDSNRLSDLRLRIEFSEPGSVIPYFTEIK